MACVLVVASLSSPSVIGVSIPPGWIDTTRTPFSRSSSRRQSPNVRSANFDAEYTLLPGVENSPAPELTSTTVPLARCAELFGYSPDEAAKRAARAALPVPAFRRGSQKSPWLINVEDLDAYLEDQRRQALQ